MTFRPSALLCRMLSKTYWVRRASSRVRVHPGLHLPGGEILRDLGRAAGLPIRPAPL